MDKDKMLRDHLVKLLQGDQAYMSLNNILYGITVADAGSKEALLPYTIWKLIEHLRIALYDILEFSRDPSYESPAWPEGYWPKEDAPPDQAALDTSIQKIQAGLEAMIQLVEDPANDLFQPFAHGNGQNLLREAMLVAEHNAYHLGQILVLRRLLQNWE